MLKKIGEFFDVILNPVQSVPVGSYQLQGNREGQLPYRLNLRVEPDGTGILIIDASTVLHLNRTAADYAYHLVQHTPPEETARLIAERYNVSLEQAQQDFTDFSERINTLVHTTDLDPVTYLDMERVEPYSRKLRAPYRLDCALTYQVSGNASQDAAPSERVSHELSTLEWCTILEKASSIGIPHVVFTGGEPTLRADLPDLIAKTEELGIVSGLLTDGLRFIDPTYVKTVLTSGLDHIMLLCDPDDARFWVALHNLIADDIAVTVHFTLTAHNQEQASAVLQKLANGDVRSLSLSAADPALEDALFVLQDIAQHIGFSLVWDLPVPYSNCNPIALEIKNGPRTSQRGSRAWLYVEPDGDVLPDQGVNRVLGNMLNDPWSSIWKKR
jgi:organic radical activating enzyme